MIFQKTKQILIFLAFLVFYLSGSLLLQTATVSRIPVLPRAICFVIGAVLVVLFVWSIIKVIRRRQPDFGILPINFRNGRKALWILGMWGLAVLLLMIAGMFIGIIRFIITGKATPEVSQNQHAIMQMANNASWQSLVILVLVLVVVAPLCEELLFRGLFLDYFDSHKYWWPGPVASGIAFGLMHVVLQKWAWTSLLDAVPYIALGIVLAYTYKHSGRISNSMAVHFMQNSLSSIYLVATYVMQHH
ncbi:type II CAAX endopeptidase family protein [Lactobacillaceae bacterium L1_55_11]|nr:type II CAAX endopeptidase family protein [Lactobacillaceae bacterium L1_55_11]